MLLHVTESAREVGGDGPALGVRGPAEGGATLAHCCQCEACARVDSAVTSKCPGSVRVGGQGL